MAQSVPDNPPYTLHMALRTLLALLILPMFTAGAFGQAPPATPSGGAGSLAAQVLQIFTAHCTQCHGADLAKPKGKFGYVTDLPRLVADHQVEPKQPGESELFKLLTTDDPDFKMPPKAAKAGPLSDAQIATVKAWIEAGAPAPAAAEPAGGSGKPARSPASKPQATQSQLGLFDRVLAFGGKFHPVVVHFPIALLMVGALAEAMVLLLGQRWARDAACLVVPLGALAAATAAILGLLSANYGGYSTAKVFTHRLLGIIVGALALLTAFVQIAHVRRPTPLNGLLYRAGLFASAALVGLTGHFGGIMVYGEDHFDF